MSDNVEQAAKAKKNWFRTSLKYAGLMILSGGLVFVASANFAKIPGEESVASGEKRNSAVYVRMSDGTQIAVDIWLPPQIKAGEKLPVILETTRYWRAQQVGWVARGLYGLGIGRESLAVGRQMTFLHSRRFIIINVDARGTGASGGNRAGEWAPPEVKDLGEVAHWASQQPWSNGKIGAMGISYSGNTAELIASTGEPSLKAVAPLYDDFDPFAHNSNPGGIFNTGFISVWGKATSQLDANNICGLAETPGLLCVLTKSMVRGVKPVDADRDGSQLVQILRTRKSNNVINGLTGVEYRDDPFKDGEGISLAAISPFSKRVEIEKYQVPMLVWSSWIDAATTDGTLSRYMTFNSPQEVVIGAYSHGGDHDADPFSPVDESPMPNADAQHVAIADFFDKYLRDTPAPSPIRMINYFTMGARTWHRTPVWPPAGTTRQTLYFGAQSSLGAAPAAFVTPDSYAVNFSAAMGTTTRWNTQMGGGDVIYPDRRTEDAKLLTYTSSPMTEATEITGTAIVSVFLSTTATDGALFAYLEDVAPDGRVTYVTEGILRLANRKENAANLPYASLGVNRSFARADALPVVPGEVMAVRIPLYATSVQLKAGHRIRIALAGAANGSFDRTPKTGNATWTLYRDAARPSGVELPIVR
jgi:uncharacterized protein